MTEERMVYLALSQKAAKVLRGVIDNVEEMPTQEEVNILDAIYADLREQIEKPKKKAKRKK